MAINNNPVPENITPYIIRFQNNEYRLRIEQLRKQIGNKNITCDNWYPATLKFISFKNGRLEVLNSCNRLSRKLILEVKEGLLLATCNCDNKSPVICDHVFGALRTIIWDLGEYYFEKLRPNGIIPLAIAHKNYFDKKECKAGLDVSVRPELESVFKLHQWLTSADLSAVLKLPDPAPLPFIAQNPKVQKYTHDEAVCYLLIIPTRNRFLPFVVPCAGKLFKNKTGIKTFYDFLRGAKKQYDNLLTDGQKELNAACFQLWKLAEKLPGSILEGSDVKKITDSRLLVFEAWRKMLFTLQRQSFVYSYFLYRTEQLKKGRPTKGRVLQIQVSAETPTISFVLTDCGAFYQIQMQVLVKGEPLIDYEADTTFFISQGRTIYLLASLRDATMVQWIDSSATHPAILFTKLL